MGRQYTIIASALLVAFLASANAACDNSCSGHGTCTYDDRCECWDNWGMGLEEGGDCSDRMCPYEVAWVDNANTDGVAHNYAECAGRGICDRTSGLCTCFDGFEGKACQRTTCPNSCSGHGRCSFLNELPVGSVYSDGYESDIDVHPRVPGDALKYWDSEMTRGCVCDPLYHGVDCSLRLCPRGTDILDLKLSIYDVSLQVPQIQRIKLVPFYGEDVDTAFGGNTFALVFKSLLNETFTTIPILFPTSEAATSEYDLTTVTKHYDTWDSVVETTAGSNIIYEKPDGEAFSHSAFAEAIEDALIALPNQVIDDVTVHVSKRYYSPAGAATNETALEYFNIDVTFVGTAVQGPQNLLMVQTDTCGVGCTPQLTGLHVQEYVVEDGATTETLMYSSVSQQRKSDFNSYECGRRGKCDYNTGICACFTGYTGESCNVQTALV